MQNNQNSNKISALPKVVSTSSSSVLISSVITSSISSLPSTTNITITKESSLSSSNKTSSQSTVVSSTSAKPSIKPREINPLTKITVEAIEKIEVSSKSSQAEILVEKVYSSSQSSQESVAVSTSSAAQSSSETPKEVVKEAPKETLLETKTPEQPPVETKPLSYQEMITQRCEELGCNAKKIISIMMCESSGNQNARNGIYTGIFQFSPATFKSYAKPQYANLEGANLYSASDQIYVATWMIANGYANQWSCN